MSADSQQARSFYQELYALQRSPFGANASDLAREAAVIARATFPGEAALHVLDLGSGDGRDSLFFAQQGCRVTAVDASPTALAALRERAVALGVESRVETICTAFEDLELPRGSAFHLVLSNYSLHFVEPARRRRFFARIKGATRPEGVHAHLALADLNEEFIGDLATYRYLAATELAHAFRDWQILDAYSGPVEDEHPGVAPHEHVAAIVIAQRPPRGSRLAAAARAPLGLLPLAAALAVGSFLLSTLLCTLGYSSLDSDSVARIWPGAAFNAFAGAALGGFGVLAGVAAGMLTNAVNVGTATAVLAFVPANLVQTWLPALYYRRLLRQGGWNARAFAFWRFAVFAAIIPNVCGAALGAAAIHLADGAPFVPVFAKWLASNLPVAFALGWPLFRLAIPAFVREGAVVKGWWR